MSEGLDRQVSFDDEPLILVDDQDSVTGYASKYESHRGAGTLHRAFSVFIFTSQDRVLLQQRSRTKPLWPLYWTNTCCSHPRKGESYLEAAGRRIKEELGFAADLHRLYRFKYHARFGDIGSERELCTVFIGYVREDVRIVANSNEVADWEWVDRRQVDRQVSAQPGKFTPWFLMEWRRLRGEYETRVRSICDSASSGVTIA